MIEPYVGPYASAKSALSEINPTEIAAACSAIEAATEGFKTSATKITSIGTSCGPDVLYIGGKTISADVGAVADTFAAQAAGILGMISGLPEEALAQYNKLQQKYNDAAIAKNNQIAAEIEDRNRNANTSSME